MSIGNITFNIKLLLILVTLALYLTAPVQAQETEWKRLSQEAGKFYNQGQFAQAAELAQQALRFAENSFTPEHPFVVTSLNNLAGVYKAQRQYAQAETLYQRALKTREKTLGPEHPNVATSLSSLAELYRVQGQYAQAEPLYRRALAIREKSLTPEHVDLATSLSNLAEASYAQGQYAAAEPLYQRALAIYEKTLGPEHPFVSASLNNLAELYRTQGRFAQAEPLYKHALTIDEKAFGLEHPNVASSLNNLAVLYRGQGQFAQAEPLYKRALSINEKAFGPAHPDVATSLNNLAELYKAQSQYAQAEPLYQRALLIYEKTLGPDHPNVATSLNNLAGLYKDQGQFAQAEPRLNRALAILEKAFGPEHPEVATSLNNLAELYRTQGQYAQAEPLYKRALAILEKVLGPEHSLVATSLNNLAELYRNQGQYAQAEPLYKRALTINEKALGAAHPDVATSLNNLAELYKAQGLYTQAEPLYKRALAIYEKVLGAEHPYVATSLNNLAGLYHSQGQYGQAEPYYMRSLTIREKTLGAEHPDVATSLNNLAELYKAQGQYTQAEPLYKRALAIIEKSHGKNHPNIALSLSNLAFMYRDQNRLKESLDTIRQSTRILARRAKLAAENSTAQHSTAQASGADSLTTHATLIGQILPSVAPGARPKLIDEAYAVAQRASSGDTGAALAQMAARASAGNGPLAQKVRAQQDTIAAWRQLDKQLIDAIGKPAAQRNAVTEKDLRQKLSDADTRIAQLNAELQRNFPEYRELISPEPLSVADTQKLLKPDEALVSYLVADQETLLWVIRPQRVEMLRIAISHEALSKQIALLRQGTDLSTGDLPVFPYATAYALYKTLFAPAEPFLKGAKHVILVADGPMQSLPFGMLLSAATPIDKDAAWLIRQYAFSNLPAVTSLRALRRFGNPSTAREPFMGFGDPILKGAPGEARGVSVAKIFARGAVADTREVQGMARLPESADELRAIAKTLKADKKNVVLAEAATEQQVKKTDLTPFRVLAFATHGLMAGDFKGLAEPALVLTPPQNPNEQDDGLLTASEVAGLKLNADWVVLSACNTAAPDGTPGADGFSGLTKAFFYAGSQSLLVSHWAVASQATVLLTTRMFAEAEKGVGRAEALRRAMLALIDHPNNTALQHPAIWAPFVVVGEGGVRR